MKVSLGGGWFKPGWEDFSSVGPASPFHRGRGWAGGRRGNYATLQENVWSNDKMVEVDLLYLLCLLSQATSSLPSFCMYMNSFM